MHVLFVEPAFPQNQREFTRALHQCGARVTGIGERPIDALDPELKSWMQAYEQVSSVVDEGALLDTVRRCQQRGWVDRLETTVEAHVLPTANVRKACGIPGTSVETAFLCRDKPAMKQVLREAGVPCARSTGASSAEEVRDFAEQVGYPLILKPRAAAGASGTYKASNLTELERVIAETGVDRGASVAVEEFIEGHEGFYDTVCLGGRVVHEFISHYYPNVLEAMRERRVSPQFLATNRMDAPGYQDVRDLAARVIASLGIETSATHMEWFFGPKGLKFSEIGCRPPGVDAWELYCAGNEMDLYVEWARTVLGEPASQWPSRRFAAGHVALRPDQDGTIVSYEGVDEIFERYGDAIFESHLPPPGSSTQPVEAGFKANAWLRLRHPDYDELRRMLDRIGRTIKIHAR